MTRPEDAWRAEFARQPEASLAWADRYFDLADHNRAAGGACWQWLVAFAYRLNDLAVEYLTDLRHPRRRQLPPFAKDIARARGRGRVPVPHGCAHVRIGRLIAYRQSVTVGAYVAAPGNDFEAYDWRFLAGLDVEILACACDLPDVDAWAATLARYRVRRVYLQRLDKPLPASELLYDGSRPWRR